MGNLWSKISRYANSNSLMSGTTAKVDMVTFFRDETLIPFPTPRFTNEQYIKITCVQLSNKILPTWFTSNAL